MLGLRFDSVSVESPPLCYQSTHPPTHPRDHPPTHPQKHRFMREHRFVEGAQKMCWRVFFGLFRAPPSQAPGPGPSPSPFGPGPDRPPLPLPPGIPPPPTRLPPSPWPVLLESLYPPPHPNPNDPGPPRPRVVRVRVQMGGTTLCPGQCWGTGRGVEGCWARGWVGGGGPGVEWGRGDGIGGELSPRLARARVVASRRAAIVCCTPEFRLAPLRLREYIQRHRGGLRTPRTPLNPGPPARERGRVPNTARGGAGVGKGLGVRGGTAKGGRGLWGVLTALALCPG